MKTRLGPTAAHSHHPERHSSEAGFALTVALLTLIGITALAAAGFLLASTDYRVTQNHRSSVYAFYAADAGMAEVLGQRGVPRATSTFNYPGGRQATVTTTLLGELDSGIRLYEVNATGQHADPLSGSLRYLHNVALFTPFPLNVPGAFTAPNGLRKNGDEGTVSGFDASSAGECPGTGDAVAGVAVPPNGYQQKGGKEPVPEGDPAIDDTEPALKILQATGIDWDGLISEDKVSPDYTVPPDSWPDFSQLGPDEWPVIHVTSPSFELKPGHSGRGVIVLDGDAELNGEFSWDGILLAGGRLTSNGNQTVEGAVFTGLNLLVGGSPEPSDIANGEKTFVFHHCNVEAAKRAMGWLAEKPGAWFEAI